MLERVLHLSPTRRVPEQGLLRPPSSAPSPSPGSFGEIWSHALYRRTMEDNMNDGGLLKTDKQNEARSEKNEDGAEILVLKT